MKRMFWLLQAVVFYLLTWLVALLPPGFSRKLGTATGELIYRLLGSRRRIAEENIARSLDHMKAQPGWSCTIPDAAGIAREVFRNIGRSLVETCRLYHGRADDLIDGIELRGREYYETALARGRGIVLLTGHCGNWELGALASSRRCKVPIAVVARRQNNPYLNRMVETMRMRYDNSVIYKKNALKNMIAVIRQNGVIGLLVDQAVFPAEGCLIPFLGRPAWASRAPVLLTRKTGVAVIPIFIHREGDRHVIEMHPELLFSDDSSEEGVRQDVKRYSEVIEQFIVRHPTEWYWVHRRWKRAEEP